MRRALAGAAVTAVLVAGVASPALADWIDELGPPKPGSAEASGNTLQARVSALEPRVNDLRVRIRDIVQQRTEGTTTVIDLNTDLLFEFAKAEVNPAGAAKLAELIKPIPQGATVQVHGHTDGIGSDESNMKLSIDRANAVAAVIKQSRGDLQLDVQGFGETKPLKPEQSGGEDDPEARAQNRRVEVRYQG